MSDRTTNLGISVRRTQLAALGGQLLKERADLFGETHDLLFVEVIGGAETNGHDGEVFDTT